jgi:hypothetical protein
LRSVEAENAEAAVLLVPVSDPALGQVVWRQFQRNPVAIHDLDSIPAEPSRHGRQHFWPGFELDRKHAGLELLDYFTGDFNCVFFWQMFFFPVWSWMVNLRQDRTRQPGPQGPCARLSKDAGNLRFYGDTERPGAQSRSNTHASGEKHPENPKNRQLFYRANSFDKPA